jgi:hypothetical protein
MSRSSIFPGTLGCEEQGMDAAQLVQRAQEGDVESFVALTQRLQH